MKTPNQKKSGDLVLALQRLHSLIGIAFPMETTRLTPGKVETLPASHEGSRLFISTRLFGNIQEQVPKIQAQLETLGADSWENNVRRLWREIEVLLSRIALTGRGGNPEAINNAFTLLYLGSGFLPNYICLHLNIAVPITPESPAVESVEQLIEVSGQTNELNHLSTEQLFDSILTQCRNCLVGR